MTTQTRKLRRSLAVAAVAAVAALSVAGPAQATLSSGLTNGGCLSGIQVGHITHTNGDVTPIWQTLG